MRQNYYLKDSESGFTLLELMIVVAIAGILVVIAYPSYQSQMKKGYISDALSDLSNSAFNMEQAYQENRSYQDPNNAGSCAVADYTGTHFSFSCSTASRTTFTWTATSLSGAMGAAGDYIYTIDQSSTKKTTKYDGVAVTYNSWES